MVGNSSSFNHACTPIWGRLLIFNITTAKALYRTQAFRVYMCRLMTQGSLAAEQILCKKHSFETRYRGEECHTRLSVGGRPVYEWKHLSLQTSSSLLSI
jgi:hypothetical protein